MNIDLIIPILAASVQAGTPILYATLGAIINERAGVLNMGVEGLMALGALIAFLVLHVSGNPWLAFWVAGFAAGGIALVHGLVCLVFQGNQVVSGIALTIFGVGAADYLGSPFVGTRTEGFYAFKVPFLGDIPFVGEILFRHDALVLISYALPFLLWLFLARTPMGLTLRATGEYPAAVEAAGINPRRVQWLAIYAGGVLMGLGGAYISLAYTHSWTYSMSAGRGWIAVALVIFSFWRPVRALLGAYLFGGVMAFQLRLQAAGTDIPAALLMMLPYGLTVLVLLWSSARGTGRLAPASLGINILPKD